MAGAATRKILNMEQYQFEEITDGNLSDLVFLVKKVAGKQLSVAYYQKKYNTPQAGGRYHGWLAYDERHQPVSVAAALPMLLQLPNGNQIPATQMIETFTLPEHRGRGLMTKMVQMILDTHQTAGIRLFFGLLNQNNVHPFTKKLGFVHTHTMRYYALDTGALPVEAIARRLGINSWYQRYVNRITAPYLMPPGSVLPNSAIAEGYGGVVHNEVFFKYKTFTMNCLCDFSGVQSWLKFENGLLVGDVQLPANCTQVAFDGWLSELKALAKKTGLRRIFFQTYEGSRVDVFLQARHAPNPSWAACCLSNDPVIQAILPQLRFGFGDFETY
jgi:GNAT superfamily N-acetyltransferase